MRILNFIAFILFSAFFVPIIVLVYFVQPVWEKWSEDAFKF